MRRVVVVALSLLASACGDEAESGTVDAGPGDVRAASELPLAADPAGAWYAGDLHVHATGASNDAGEESTPEAIKRVAMERGLYFVVLTDHSNSTGSDTTTTEEDPALFNQGPEFPYWDRAAELSEAGVFLMMDGNEISPVTGEESRLSPTGHIGCVPQDPATFDTTGAFTDRPRGSVTGGEVLQQALDRGCFAIVNHPYGAPWTSYDWTAYGYHGMEIWNGTTGLDRLDYQGHDAWRCDLLAGRDVVPIAASDNHRTLQDAPGTEFDPALGHPKTSVFASGGTWAEIVDGLQAGMVMLHEGETTLAVDGYAEDGARTEGPAMRWLRVRASVDARAPFGSLRVTRATGCDDPRPDHLALPEVSEDALLEQRLESGESVDLAIRVGGEPGIYTAEIGTRVSHYGALSRAIVVR